MELKQKFSLFAKSGLHWPLILLTLGVATWVVTGCSKSSSGDTGTAAPTNCPSGYSSTTQGCVATNGTTPLIVRSATQTTSFYAQSTNTSVFINQVNQSQFRTYSGYKDLLREAMGVCDRNHVDIGATSCEAWLQGIQDLVIQFTPGVTSDARVVIRSFPVQNSTYGYYFSSVSPKEFLLGLIGFPVGNASGIFNPMLLDVKVWPTNDSKGFALWGQLPNWSYAWNRMLKITVPTGKMEELSFNFTMSLDDTQIADGTFIRCTTESCGM